MKVKGTYFQNSADQPLVYGEVETINPPRRKLRGLEEKQGIIAESAFVGFCGTDFELMHMGQRGQLNAKFPACLLYTSSSKAPYVCAYPRS